MAPDPYPCSAVDDAFYQAADLFFPAQQGVALTYDDVTLATQYSEILPRDANLETTLSERLQLQIPIISADMDTVTESRMAIAMALNGGIGLIHYNMPERQQLSEVTRVKYHVHGLIQEPIKVSPDQFIGDVLGLIEERHFSFSTFPIVDENDRLLGLLPGHVVRPRYSGRKVSEAMMPRAHVQTIPERELQPDPIARADRFFNEHVGIHKLLVVDDEDRLRGLFTLSDIERITQEKAAPLKPGRDAQFRLVCGAAISATRNSTGELDQVRILQHVGALVERGVDVVAISTAHGFSKGVGEAVRMIRDAHPELPIIAGNVTSAAAVEYLARLRRQRGEGGPGTRFDLHDAHRGRGRHPAIDGALCLRKGRGGGRGPYHRRRRHCEKRRYREGADAFACGDLRRTARGVPGGARADH